MWPFKKTQKAPKPFPNHLQKALSAYMQPDAMSALRVGLQREVQRQHQDRRLADVKALHAAIDLLEMEGLLMPSEVRRAHQRLVQLIAEETR